MKRIYILIIALAMVGSLSAQQVIEVLTAGSLKGTGTLMGSAADFSMNWEWTLNDQFLRLTFENKRKSAEGKPIVFKANGYYQLMSDSTLSGNWFDSRGVTFPLKGTVSDTELTIIWGTNKTEQGKTIYKLVENEQISVIDFFLNQGQYQQFGAASYPIK